MRRVDKVCWFSSFVCWRQISETSLNLVEHWVVDFKVQYCHRLDGVYSWSKRKYVWIMFVNTFTIVCLYWMFVEWLGLYQFCKPSENLRTNFPIGGGETPKASKCKVEAPWRRGGWGWGLEKGCSPLEGVMFGEGSCDPSPEKHFSCSGWSRIFQ